MKMLKKQSLKSVLVLVILLYVFCAILGAVMIPSLSNASKDPISLDEIDYSGDIDGLYVSGTIYGIYDWYCEETQDDKTIAKEYIIDADDYYYIGLRAEHSDMDAADALLDASTKYLDGLDDGTLLAESQYEVFGVIKAMPEDSLQFYYEYADWCEIDREIFLPYYIEIGTYGDYDGTDMILFGILIAFLFGLGTLFLVWALTGHYQKEVKKYIDNSGSPELAASKVDNFLRTTPLVNGMRYNHEFICGNSGATTVFGETPKLAWAYKHVVNHKRYFITVSKSYSIVLGFTDGTRQMAGVKKEAMVDEHLQNLQALCPKAIFGYSAELDQMFRKNLPQFLSLRYNAPEQPVAEPADEQVTND